MCALAEEKQLNITFHIVVCIRVPASDTHSHSWLANICRFTILASISFHLFIYLRWLYYARAYLVGTRRIRQNDIHATNKITRKGREKMSNGTDASTYPFHAYAIARYAFVSSHLPGIPPESPRKHNETVGPSLPLLSWLLVCVERTKWAKFAWILFVFMGIRICTWSIISNIHFGWSADLIRPDKCYGIRWYPYH